MSDQERPLIDRVWEFTKDISVKVSRKAEKHWKINTLRVEIASIRHRINVKYKELGRYVYESVKSQTLEEDSYKASLREFFDELKRLEGEILQRENRIEILEQEMREAAAQPKQPPPFTPPVGETAAETQVVDAEVVSEKEVSPAPPEATAQAEAKEADSSVETSDAEAADQNEMAENSETTADIETPSEAEAEAEDSDQSDAVSETEAASHSGSSDDEEEKDESKAPEKASESNDKEASP